MNQIMITEKIYVTPELRRKRKLYKIELVISIILVCLLFGYYVYAEYDRLKEEEVSRDLLDAIDFDGTSDTTLSDDDVMVIGLSDDIDGTDPDENAETLAANLDEQIATRTVTTTSGATYTTEARIQIPSLGLNYPVLSDTNDDLLKISLNKYWGPAPNSIGNYCVVGHNYKNGTMFGELSEIQMGAQVIVTDVRQNSVTYEVYQKYVVEPTDVSCTSQLTNGQRILTLITCTNYGQQRTVVKCREVR